jgi:hypothetical protein
MPFLLGLLGIIAAAYFWAQRAKGAADMAGDMMDMARDVKAAARRFGFTRKHNTHPVESIDDVNLAIGSLATAFHELEDLPTAESRAALDVQLRKHLKLSAEEAQEITILGHWFVNECGGADPAVTRLSKKLFKLDGAGSFPTLMGILNDTVAATTGSLGRKQSEALDDIKRASHIN